MDKELLATTRDAVLEAAMIEFLGKPYDKATLRSISQKAGVDVAYVHRLFGSKQAMFTAVLSAIFDRLKRSRPTQDDFMKSLFEIGENSNPAQMFNGLDPTDLFIHSLGNQDARALMVKFIRTEFLDPLEASIESEEAEIVSKQLYAYFIGIRIIRRCIGLPDSEDGGSAILREETLQILRGLG